MKLKNLGTFAVLSLSLLMAAAQPVYAYESQLVEFKDVKASDWSYESVYSLSALGIIDGETASSYNPTGLLSREAFIKLLVASSQAEVKDVTGPSPTDVPASRWSYPYIAFAHQHGLIRLLEDDSGAFYPDRHIAREEVAALIGQFLLDSQPEDFRNKWIQSGWNDERTAKQVKDDGQIAQALAPFVYYAINQGIVEGDETGIRPKDTLSRQEAAAIIYRLANKAAAGRHLNLYGYYAIKSYPAIQQIPVLSQVAFGWSHLKYETAGEAGLQTADTEYRIPDGWEQPVQAAKTAKTPSDLMVYYSNENLRDFLKDKPAQKAFIDSLLQTLNRADYGFTGVSIDFEGLKDSASAADYVQFLTSLKAGLGSRPLTVAVPPVFYYKGYDLQKIGEIADTVVLMAYDFTHQESLLPSAPLPLVSESVRQALAAIPKEKLVLGISKQANQWVTSSQGTTSYFQPDIGEVEKRFADSSTKQAWRLPLFLREGTYDDERGRHVIYYEDTASIAKKMWLAKYYGLKGVSLWYMGNFTSSDWAMIGQNK